MDKCNENITCNLTLKERKGHRSKITEEKVSVLVNINKEEAGNHRLAVVIADMRYYIP